MCVCPGCARARWAGLGWAGRVSPLELAEIVASGIQSTINGERISVQKGGTKKLSFFKKVERERKGKRKVGQGFRSRGFTTLAAIQLLTQPPSKRLARQTRIKRTCLYNPTGKEEEERIVSAGNCATTVVGRGRTDEKKSGQGNSIFV